MAASSAAAACSSEHSARPRTVMGESERRCVAASHRLCASDSTSCLDGEGDLLQFGEEVRVEVVRVSDRIEVVSAVRVALNLSGAGGFGAEGSSGGANVSPSLLRAAGRQRGSS